MLNLGIGQTNPREQEHMSLVVRNRLLAFAKTKTQISFAVTAKLISLCFCYTDSTIPLLPPKFQASSHLLWLYSPVCVGPGRKPRRRVFSEQGSYEPHHEITWLLGFQPGLTQNCSHRKLARCLKFQIFQCKNKHSDQPVW